MYMVSFPTKGLREILTENEAPSLWALWLKEAIVIRVSHLKLGTLTLKRGDSTIV
ncbi:hypothetical protein MASR2M41_26390 [Flammeovirgaceae bacterium]